MPESYHQDTKTPLGSGAGQSPFVNRKSTIRARNLPIHLLLIIGGVITIIALVRPS